MSPSHDNAVRFRLHHRRPLAIALSLVVIFMVSEVLTGWWTGSLALVSDAGHMATDALGLGMALAAILAANNAGDDGRRTYGLYRAEIFAALANAVLLSAVAGYVLFEAAKRIDEPPDVLTGPMLAIAFAGLGVNVIAWRLLRRSAKSSLNVEGAYIEVLADLIGSIGVIAAVPLSG